MQRRSFLHNSGVLMTAVAMPFRAVTAAEESQLIYLSPFKSNGDLSRCQSEVWYVQDGDDLYVVTASNAWRARAVAAGLTRTRVWVGDVGQWQRADGRYRTLPSLVAEASQVPEAIEHARVLEKFGAKYSGEWDTWGPRFRDGLADGSRVMLRYQPV